jgi:transcriptional regulator with XRE-family HTH domain
MTVGKRLKDERTRLQLTLDEMGARGGVKKNAQIKYEADERSPDAGYLVGISEAGADVLYVLTGRRRIDMPANEAERQAVLMALQHSGGLPAPSAPHMAEALAQYQAKQAKLVRAGGHLGVQVADERQAKLLSWYIQANETGKKMIERVAEMEASRPKPNRKKSAMSTHIDGGINVSGDGNSVGNNNQSTVIKSEQ